MFRAVLCAVVLSCLPALPAAAQYQVLHGAAVSGGGVGSGDHVIHAAAGQPAIGIAFGADNSVKAGFWYCAGISSTVDVAVTSLFAELRDDAVILVWSASRNASFDGFNVYRAAEDGAPFERINEELLPPSATASYRDATAEPGRSYRYRIGAAGGGNEWYSAEAAISLPWKPFTLYQNVPNPFNPSTSIAFYTPRRARVRLAVYDVRGALVRTLVDDVRDAGTHRVPWNGTNNAGAAVASGVYCYRIEADKTIVTKKLVIVR